MSKPPSVLIEVVLFLGLFARTAFSSLYTGDITDFVPTPRPPVIPSLMTTHSRADSCEALIVIAGREQPRAVRLPHNLPAHIVEEIGQPLQMDGPNSFNLVLRMSGRSEELKTTSSKDFLNFLRDETTKLDANSPKQMGDVIVVWENKNLRHAAVFIGDGLVVHKATPSRYSSTEVQELNEMAEIWGGVGSNYVFTVHRPRSLN
jgi:hypothetical protein